MQTPSNHPPSLALLFSRYMRGEITDRVWTNLMRLLDADGLGPNERLAFADYVNDVVQEKGKLRFPRMQEIRDLLSATRH